MGRIKKKIQRKFGLIINRRSLLQNMALSRNMLLSNTATVYTVHETVFMAS